MSAPWGTAGRMAVSVTVLLLSCQQEPTLDVNALEPIRIGTISSLTGGLESVGSAMVDAATLAVQEANAAGGPLPGRRVELIVADDETDADVAARVAKRLVNEEQVVGIIGAPGSGMSLRVAEVVGPVKVPQISGTSTSPDLNAVDEHGEDLHPYFFRTVPADDLQGWVLGSAARGEFNNDRLQLDCSRLVVLYLDNPYGAPFGDALRGRFEELGGTVVAHIPFEDGLPTYTPQVQQAIGANPDCLAMVAYVESGGTIVREWYSQGGSQEVIWLGTDGIKDTGFIDEAGIHAAGVVGTTPASNPNRGERLRFEGNYRTTFGLEADEDVVVFSDAVYDATFLLMLAIAQAGNTRGEDLRQALFDVSARGVDESTLGPGELVEAFHRIRTGEGIDYEGAAGAVDFLETGDVVADYEVWICDGTAFEQVTTVTADLIEEGMQD